MDRTRASQPHYPHHEAANRLGARSVRLFSPDDEHLMLVRDARSTGCMVCVLPLAVARLGSAECMDLP